jgi:hypothetical protein
VTEPPDVHESFVPSGQASGGSDLDEPCGVAVDGTGIYWSDANGGTVGHANLDGPGERTLLTGTDPVCRVTLRCWDNKPYTGSATIGRALQSADAVDNTYITGLNGPCGAVVASHHLSSKGSARSCTADRAPAALRRATQISDLTTQSVHCCSSNISRRKIEI